MGHPLPPDYGPIRTKLLSQWCAFLPITIYERLESTRNKPKGYAISRKVGNMPERVRIPLRPPFLFQKLLRGFDGEVGAGDYFFGQQDVDSDFAVTLLVGRIATPKIPKPALVFAGSGFQYEAQLGQG